MKCSILIKPETVLVNQISVSVFSGEVQITKFLQTYLHGLKSLPLPLLLSSFPAARLIHHNNLSLIPSSSIHHTSLLCADMRNCQKLCTKNRRILR